jgi:hypothetical protein
LDNMCFSLVASPCSLLKRSQNDNS